MNRIKAAYRAFRKPSLIEGAYTRIRATGLFIPEDGAFVALDGLYLSAGDKVEIDGNYFYIKEAGVELVPAEGL